MEYQKESIQNFLQALSEKTPIPGGGGASALIGAIGIALGSMVGSLTVGKPKYAAVDEEMQRLIRESNALRKELLTLMDRDAEVFSPLARTYAMPTQTEQQRAEKTNAMEPALRAAAEVPLSIMEKCCSALDMISEFAKKGSRLAISDAGCAAAICTAALKSACLNVLINTKTMQDRKYAQLLIDRANQILANYCPQADEIYENILKQLI